ncbi:MAG: acyltransferase [Elusimicrobiales bacterium]|nr:acyltransferase [Elusimicrobiales bacterium]
MRKYLRRKILLLLGLPKTLLFNFKYFPLRDALKLPVYVSHRVWLMEMSGEVRVRGPLHRGMIEIGFGEVGIFDQHRSRSIWQVSGRVEFEGPASIGHGTRLSVSGVLRMGADLRITAESAIVASNSVSIGAGSLFSWDVLVIDTDFHGLYGGGELLNPSAPVRIGAGVWIGCRALVLKGSVLPDGTVVAAASTVTREFTAANTLIGGSPAVVLKENVSWRK